MGILYLNYRGLGEKTSELSAWIYYIKPDKVYGTESHLNGIKPGKEPDKNEIKSSEKFPHHYNMYRHDKNTDGGGVFILLHKSLVSLEQPEFVTNCEIVWEKIQIQGVKEMYIATFYTSHRNLQDLVGLNTTFEIFNEKGNRHVILFLRMCVIL